MTRDTNRGHICRNPKARNASTYVTRDHGQFAMEYAPEPTHEPPVPPAWLPVTRATEPKTTPTDQLANDGSSARDLAALPQRDQDVLQEIARGGEAQVGFQGIKRRLELHPEALRRVLARLQRDAVIEKGPYGYALAPEGKRMLAGTLLPAESVRPIPVAGLLLPRHLSPQDILDRLARRWFDGLHWYGMSDGYGEATLMWLTTEGNAVRLRVGVGRLRLDVSIPDAGLDEALAATAPLVGAVTELIRSSAKSSPAPPTHPKPSPPAGALGDRESFGAS